MTDTSNTIATFKQNFNGGTRPNRFEVDLSTAFPNNLIKVFQPNENEKFKIYAANLPQADLGTLQVPYRGRILHLAGDRNYTTWTIGVYDDNNNDNLWKSFQHWKDRMDGHETHQVGGAVAVNEFSFRSLQTTWRISQLDLNGRIIRKMELYNCWPEQVSALNLDMNSSKFSVFSVNIVFDWYKVVQGWT
jgi:hypothetical protein